MLRSGGSKLTRLTGVLVGDAKCGSSAFALEFVRWRRKPRWMPVAKSKLYRIPERPEQTPDEKVELQRLHNNYHTQMRSVRQYLREEAIRIKATTTKDHIVLTVEQEEEEFQRCLKLNETWNNERAAERNQRLEKERQERAAYIKERLELAIEREEERRERIDAIVKREKELAKMFITRDKLDAAIDAALANPVDYNFSIDLSGNIYRGRLANADGGDGAPTTSETERQSLQATNN